MSAAVSVGRTFRDFLSASRTQRAVVAAEPLGLIRSPSVVPVASWCTERDAGHAGRVSRIAMSTFMGSSSSTVITLASHARAEIRNARLA